VDEGRRFALISRAAATGKATERMFYYLMRVKGAALRETSLYCAANFSG
jgi:hypothetical protein